jgi:hypothetical protein
MSSVEGPPSDQSPPLLERRCQLTPGRTILTQHWGVLRLHPAGLIFVADKASRSFKAPMAELHSPRNWVARGITIYRGRDRLKFDFSYRDPFDQASARVHADHPAAFVSSGISQERSRGQDAASAAATWTAALAERVSSSPPTGVRVAKTYGPDQRAAYIAGVLAIVALVTTVGIVVMILVMMRVGSS